MTGQVHIEVGEGGKMSSDGRLVCRAMSAQRKDGAVMLLCDGGDPGQEAVTEPQ